MVTFQFTIFGFVLGLLLLAVPLVAANYFGCKLENQLLKSLSRYALMLVVAGALCFSAVKLNTWWASLLVVLLLLVLSALLTLMISKQTNARLFLPLLAGMAAGLLPVGAYVLLAVLGGGKAWGAQILIPLVALLLTAMSYTNGGALNTYYNGLRFHGRLYTYLRANGASYGEATDYFTRRAVRRNLLTFTREIATLSLGLGVPLAWGLVMAGADVLSAFAFALLFVVAAMAASVISLLTSLWLAKRYAFDSYDALKHSAESPLDLYQSVDESQDIDQNS